MCAKRIYMPDLRSSRTNEILMQHIEDQSRVIDLGCGDGYLLERLRDEHGCDVMGIERDNELFLASIERGLPMLQLDLNAGLSSARRCSRSRVHLTCSMRSSASRIEPSSWCRTLVTGGFACRCCCRGVLP